jgi:hypothetical protein
MLIVLFRHWPIRFHQKVYIKLFDSLQSIESMFLQINLKVWNEKSKQGQNRKDQTTL